MRQLALPGDLGGLSRITLDAATSRYLVRVLRMREGDETEAVDATGRRFRCRLETASPDGAGITLAAIPAGSGVRGSRADGAAGQDPVACEADGRAAVAGANVYPLAQAPLDLPPIVLVQGFPKGPKIDSIVRQATEAGAALILPVVSEFSVARPASREEGSGRHARLERIVGEALQQSGSTIRTRILPPVDFPRMEEALDREGFGPGRALRLFCHEKPLAHGGLHGYLAAWPEAVVIAVGPEGGFSGRETEWFLRAGYLPVHFRGAVLRTETAAIYAIAAVKTVLSERRSWNPAV